jgi:hypothetical protein
MQTNKIAIYNKTREEFCEVDCDTHVANYWGQLEGNERVYVLTDYSEVDASWLDMLAHEHLIEDGWRVLN